MDVDNVLRGCGGKEAEPRDHNRDWAERPIYPEVAAAQHRLRTLSETRRLRLFLDLHQPGAEQQPSFFYAPFEYTNLAAAIRANYDRFLELAVAEAVGPLHVLPNFQFATYVATPEERARMSRTWAERQAGPQAVALSFETRWNLPESTADNYRRLGAELGRAVARFLRADVGGD